MMVERKIGKKSAHKKSTNQPTNRQSCLVASCDSTVATRHFSEARAFIEVNAPAASRILKTKPTESTRGIYDRLKSQIEGMYDVANQNKPQRKHQRQQQQQKTATNIYNLMPL